MSVTVREWPNKLGHDVLVYDSEIAQVFDDPLQPGVKVVTYDGAGDNDLVYEHPAKVDPLTAVSLAFVLGSPADPTRPDVKDYAALRKKHGASAVILIEGGKVVSCLDEDVNVLLKVGVKVPFPASDLAAHTHRLLCEGLKVVLLYEAQLVQAKGGGS